MDVPRGSQVARSQLRPHATPIQLRHRRAFTLHPREPDIPADDSRRRRADLRTSWRRSRRAAARSASGIAAEFGVRALDLPLGPDGAYTNKINQLFTLADEDFDVLVACDTDLAIMRPLDEAATTEFVRARRVDQENPPLAVLERIREFLGVPQQPALAAPTCCPAAMTYAMNCNGGMLLIPRRFMRPLGEAWLGYATTLTRASAPARAVGQPHRPGRAGRSRCCSWGCRFRNCRWSTTFPPIWQSGFRGARTRSRRCCITIGRWIAGGGCVRAGCGWWTNPYGRPTGRSAGTKERGRRSLGAGGGGRVAGAGHVGGGVGRACLEESVGCGAAGCV